MLLPMSYGYGTGHIFNSWKGEVILSTSNKQGATVVGPSTKFDISNVSLACSKDNKNYISFSGT